MHCYYVLHNLSCCCRGGRPRLNATDSPLWNKHVTFVQVPISSHTPVGRYQLSLCRRRSCTAVQYHTTVVHASQGSSVDDSTVASVRKKIPHGANVLVLLDSAHEPHHVMVSGQTFCLQIGLDGVVLPVSM